MGAFCILCHRELYGTKDAPKNLTKEDVDENQCPTDDYVMKVMGFEAEVEEGAGEYSGLLHLLTPDLLTH